MYRDRLLALPSRPPVADPDLSFDPPAGMAKRVAGASMVATSDQATRWAGYSGSYRTPAWGVISPAGAPERFVVHAGVPFFEAEDEPDSLVRHRLAEVEPGLFLADNGETLDLRSQVPTWRNLRLVRVSGGPAPWQWAILSAAALVAVMWLIAAPARRVGRSAGSRPSSRGQRVATVVAGATALLTLATVALLVWMPGLVDSGYVGGFDLSPAEWLATHVPPAVTGVGAAMVALAAWAWIGHWWSTAVTLQYATLAIAAIALVPLLAEWHLIGW